MAASGAGRRRPGRSRRCSGRRRRPGRARRGRGARGWRTASRAASAGMKCPGRLACRRAITSGLPCRWRNSVVGACCRSWSRYCRLRAEQLITPPVSACSASHSPIDSSQGCRSSSSSASPAVILAMLAGGWKSSASANGTRSRWARAAPTVDLPEPETPMATISGDRSGMRCSWLAGLAAAVAAVTVWIKDQIFARLSTKILIFSRIVCEDAGVSTAPGTRARVSCTRGTLDHVGGRIVGGRARLRAPY